jgi:hypothetical protein
MSETFRNEFEKIRINRNIVECKWVQWEVLLDRQLGINRNIVECKYTATTIQSDL